MSGSCFFWTHLMLFTVLCHECSINLATTLLKPTHETTCSRSSNAAAGCHTSSGTVNETRCAWKVSLWWKESTGKPTGDGLYTGTGGGRLNKSFPQKKICHEKQIQQLVVWYCQTFSKVDVEFWIQLVNENSSRSHKQGAPTSFLSHILELVSGSIYDTWKKHSQNIDLEHKNVLFQNKHSVSTTICWMLC